jgi:hypothetical protein
VISRRSRRFAAQRPGVPTLEALMPLMAIELQRARRYSRPLSLVSIPAGNGAPPQLRVLDLVAVAQHRLVITLPETDVEDTRGFLDRIREDGVVGGFRSATFPDQALTLPSLLSRVLDA